VAKKPDNIAVLFVILILGALIGSVIGEVIAALAPGGYVEAIFARGINPGIAPPAVLDLKVLTLTLGATMRINLASVLGIVLAVLIYRKL
jgi:hypothetical protein